VDQRDRRVAISLGSFAAVFAAKWSPRLGLDLAGGVSVVYTAEGQHVSQADLQETVNILNLRVNGLGVSGAQSRRRQEPDIVSIPGVTDASRCSTRSPDRAHVLPSGRVLAYPKARPRTQGQASDDGHRTIPACTTSSELTAANLAVTPNSGPRATAPTA